MTTHNDTCNRAQQAAREFEAAHPNYCRSCGGAGAYYDPWYALPQ